MQLLRYECTLCAVCKCTPTSNVNRESNGQWTTHAQQHAINLITIIVLAIIMHCCAHMPSNIHVGWNRQLRAGLARLLPDAQKTGHWTPASSKQQIAVQQDSNKTANTLIACGSVPKTGHWTLDKLVPKTRHWTPASETSYTSTSPARANAAVKASSGCNKNAQVRGWSCSAVSPTLPYEPMWPTSNHWPPSTCALCA